MKAQLSKEDAAFNAKNVEPNTTQCVQDVGSVKRVDVPGGYYLQDEDKQGWTWYENRVPLDKPLDYISRQAAFRIISGYQGLVDKSVAKRLITQMPSADVVEVVRCEYCKWRDKRPGVYDCHNPVFGDGHANYAPPCMREDDFCSRGERRTDGEIH